MSLPGIYLFLFVSLKFYLHSIEWKRIWFLSCYAVVYVCLVCLLPTLTPVLVSSMWWTTPHSPSLLAGVSRRGRTGAGGGHRAGQVSVHVIWVCAAHWTAAGWRWGHWWHTTHTQRSATRDNRGWLIIRAICTKHNMPRCLYFCIDASRMNSIIPGFPRGFSRHHETVHESKTEENRVKPCKDVNQ